MNMQPTGHNTGEFPQGSRQGDGAEVTVDDVITKAFKALSGVIVTIDPIENEVILSEAADQN